MRHPVTDRQMQLETRDPNEAKALYDTIMPKWRSEHLAAKNQQFIERISNAGDLITKGDKILFSELLVQFRQEPLGCTVDNGAIKLGKCSLITMRGPNRGKPLSRISQKDYAYMCRQLEDRVDSNPEEFNFSITDYDALRKLRSLLSRWLIKPRHYNHLRDVLSRVFKYGVDMGYVIANPISQIDKQISGSRKKIYVPDEAYLAITDYLVQDFTYNRAKKDGTFRAKVFDVLYMVSSRVTDALNLKDRGNDKSIFLQERMIRFTTSKTDILQEIVMNDDLVDLVIWWQEFKFKQGIGSTHLMCYPRYYRPSGGQPITARTASSWWHEAAVATGYPQFMQRDLRRKGLTDEFLNQGRNDKGGHETEAMRKHYIAIELPKRSENTLIDIRSKLNSL